MKFRRLVLFIAPLLIATTAGCAASYRYTQTAAAAAPSRAEGCDFTLIEVLEDPARYEQLGVLEDPRGDWPGTVDAFKKMARSYVCQAGGEVVVPQINGMGVYVRAVVYRVRATARAAIPSP
jgi:hypothetical protein